MSLQDDFKQFIKEISAIDLDDINVKYYRICKKLNEFYYDSDSEIQNSKKVGSIGRGTAIKGISDLDMLYEIPESTFTKYNAYESQGQSQLLQEVKNVLIETYPTSDIKGDGQVVVIEFITQHVEVLPAFYVGDSTYKFPDTKEGGLWRNTKPDLEISAINQLNENNGILISLCKMMRLWRNESGVNINGLLIDTFAYNFLSKNEEIEKYQKDYFLLVLDFFNYLKDIDDDQEYFLAPGSNQRVYKKGKICKKARKTFNKLLTMQSSGSYDLSSIFGKCFPTSSLMLAFESVIRKDYSNTEEFIEDKYGIDIGYNVEIECLVTQDGFRPTLLKNIGILRNKKSLEFFIEECDVPKPYEIYWKVRNIGNEAIKRDCIRGQIQKSQNVDRKKEPAVFSGPHYVECYIIKNGKCVARDRIDVPIKIENLP